MGNLNKIIGRHEGVRAYCHAPQRLMAFLAAMLISLNSEANDQSTAQEEARRTHDQGSDDSLKHSYKNALHAVDNFFQLNIPGAITYGVKAYGQYKNSEKLDDLRDKNQILENSMVSASNAPIIAYAAMNNSGPPGGSVGPQLEKASIPRTPGASPFVRIDPSFLREGDTAEIAERVEKITGISREKLFKMTAELHTRNLERSIGDPDYIVAVRKEFRFLVDQVPNQEFKSSMDKAVNIISMRPVQEFIAKLREADPAPAVATTMVAKLETPVAQDLKTADAAIAPPTLAASTSSSPESPSPPDSHGLSESPRFATRGDDSNAKLLGLDRLKYDPLDGYLGELMKDAPVVEDPNTLFSQVSAKIREVSSRQNFEQRAVPVVAQSHN